MNEGAEVQIYTDNYSISYEHNIILDGYQLSSDNLCQSAICADVKHIKENYYDLFTQD